VVSWFSLANWFGMAQGHGTVARRGRSRAGRRDVRLRI